VRAGLVAVLPRPLDVQDIALLVGLWVLLTFGSVALVLRVALALPEDYFERERPSTPRRWTPTRIGANVAGCVLILVGLVLAIPGVPGQGLLTILIGLFLVDFPGRRRLERRLVNRPGVLPALNRLRARFHRPPLRPPPP
jgi:hypothetical protein